MFANYVTNAIAISMFPSGVVLISKRDLTLEEAKELISPETISAIGHADLAAVVSDQTGKEVKANRISVQLQLGESAVVAAYMGPRLPEGTTKLPEGATIKYALVMAESPNWYEPI